MLIKKAIAVAAALGHTKSLASLLYGVGAKNPYVFVVTAVLLIILIFALATCAFPGWP